MKSKKIYPISRGGWRVTEWQFYLSEWNATEFLDVNEYQVLESVCKKIQDKMPTIGKGTNVMIDKTSEVPRAKFKEFLEDNGAKKVTLNTKANVVFVKRETIKYIQNFLTLHKNFYYLY